jgi:hypothetical protein
MTLKDVAKGLMCIQIKGYNDIEERDVIESTMKLQLKETEIILIHYKF